MFRKIVALIASSTIMLSSPLVSARGASQTDTSPFPAPGGPFKIGTVIRQWLDPSRDELLTETLEDKRQLLVQFWYPADPKADGTFAPYMAASDQTLTIFEALVNGSRDVTLAL